MSAEEVIHSWKNEDQDGEEEPGQAPAPPMGEIELSDEELEAVEGGLPRFIISLNESCYEICKNKE